MGFRFRKSVTLAKGVKLNLGKRGASLSVGGKHGGMTFGKNTRVRASIPGTGISYSTKVGGKSKSSRSASTKRTSYSMFSAPTATPSLKLPFFAKTWVIVVSGILLFFGLCALTTDLLSAIVCIVIGGAAFVYSLYVRFANPDAIEYFKAKKALSDPVVIRQTKIFNESLSHIMQTTNPATFFGRYSDAYKAAETIKSVTDAICIHGGTASDVIDALNNDKTKVTNAFLDRYAEEIRLKAFSLTRGRKQKVESFKLVTSEYETQMTEESINYRNQLYASMLEKLETV